MISGTMQGHCKNASPKMQLNNQNQEYNSFDFYIYKQHIHVFILFIYLFNIFTILINQINYS